MCQATTTKEVVTKITNLINSLGAVDGFGVGKEIQKSIDELINPLKETVISEIGVGNKVINEALGFQASVGKASPISEFDKQKFIGAVGQERFNEIATIQKTKCGDKSTKAIFDLCNSETGEFTAPKLSIKVL